MIKLIQVSNMQPKVIEKKIIQEPKLIDLKLRAIKITPLTQLATDTHHLIMVQTPKEVETIFEKTNVINVERVISFDLNIDGKTIVYDVKTIFLK
jgi:hypothetical protein